MASPGFPSPPPPPPQSILRLLYYGLIVVGTAAIVLALYNLLVLRWCSDRRSDPPASQIARTRPVGGSGRGGTAVALPASFQYMKEKEGDEECAVCLAALEDEEEVRRLPRCSHAFHADCIDMWLFSHPDCPLCRAPLAGRW